MFGLGFTEIVLILAVALVFLGPKKLPTAARTLGKTLAEVRRTMDDFKRELTAPRQELEEAFKEETAFLRNREIQCDGDGNPKPPEEPKPEVSENAPATSDSEIEAPAEDDASS